MGCLRAIAVNPVTNKIYVGNRNSINVTVINATKNFRSMVTTDSIHIVVAINPVTNKAYVANNDSGNMMVITPAPTNAIPPNTTTTPQAGNTANRSTKYFTVTETYSPTDLPPRNIYFQMDKANGTWTRATKTGSGATTLTRPRSLPLCCPECT